MKVRPHRSHRGLGPFPKQSVRTSARRRDTQQVRGAVPAPRFQRGQWRPPAASTTQAAYGGRPADRPRSLTRLRSLRVQRTTDFACSLERRSERTPPTALRAVPAIDVRVPLDAAPNADLRERRRVPGHSDRHTGPTPGLMLAVAVARLPPSRSRYMPARPTPAVPPMLRFRHQLPHSGSSQVQA